MESIKKINSMENKNIEHKKMQELQNKIIGQGKNIALAKGVVPDPRKRQFIKKGILGIIAGIGIAIFSKITHAGGIKFYDDPTQIIDSSRGVAKAHGRANSSGTLQTGSYNIDSCSDTGTGIYVYVLRTDMSSADYQHVACMGQQANDTFVFTGTKVAGNATVTARLDSNSTQTCATELVCLGDQ